LTADSTKPVAIASSLRQAERHVSSSTATPFQAVYRASSCRRNHTHTKSVHEDENRTGPRSHERTPTLATSRGAPRTSEARERCEAHLASRSGATGESCERRPSQSALLNRSFFWLAEAGRPRLYPLARSGFLEGPPPPSPWVTAFQTTIPSTSERLPTSEEGADARASTLPEMPYGSAVFHPTPHHHRRKAATKRARRLAFALIYRAQRAAGTRRSANPKSLCRACRTSLGYQHRGADRFCFASGFNGS
jgi:hypothetical protein